MMIYSSMYTGLSGANIISEDLRQICIWDHLASRTNKGDRILWWDYVSEFDEKCGGAVNTWTDACANTIMSSLGIDHTAVDTCIANSGGLASGQNTLLDKALVDRAESGVFYLPTVYINDQGQCKILHISGLERWNAILKVKLERFTSAYTCTHVHI